MKVNQRAYKARPEPVGRSRRWWKEKGRADGQGQASGSNIPEMLNLVEVVVRGLYYFQKCSFFIKPDFRDLSFL